MTADDDRVEVDEWAETLRLRLMADPEIGPEAADGARRRFASIAADHRATNAGPLDEPDIALLRSWWARAAAGALLDQRAHDASIAPVNTLVSDLPISPALARYCTPSILPQQSMLPWPLLHEISSSHPGFGSLTGGDGAVAGTETAVRAILERRVGAGVIGGCHLFIDGSTGALRALIEWISTCTDAPLVGVGRATHKAIVHHLDAYGVPWFFLEDAADSHLSAESRDLEAARRLHFARFDEWPPLLAHVVATAAAHRSPTHLIVNSVTYGGALADIAAISERLGARRRPILIADEAWGAHFPFLASQPSPTPPPGIAAADIVVTSAHKEGGAGQGTSVMLLRANGALDDRANQQIESVVRRTVTTSPNLPLLASVEASYTALEDRPEFLAALVRRAHDLRVSLGQLPGVDVMSAEPATLATPVPVSDPLKVVLRLDPCWGTGFALDDHLRDQHRIVLEQAGYATVTLLVTFSTTAHDDTRLVGALDRYRGLARERRDRESLGLAIYPAVVAAVTPAMRATAETVSLTEPGDQEAVDAWVEALDGRVALDTVAPYPPGIAAIVPGTVLTAELLKHLAELLDAGCHIVSGAGSGPHGLALFVEKSGGSS